MCLTTLVGTLDPKNSMVLKINQVKTCFKNLDRAEIE